jgi:hypothetical protein
LRSPTATPSAIWLRSTSRWKAKISGGMPRVVQRGPLESAQMATCRARLGLSKMMRPGEERQRDVMPEGGPVMATIAPKPRDLGDKHPSRWSSREDGPLSAP